MAKPKRMNADRLLTLLEECSAVDSPRSYSGRGMGGARCVAMALRDSTEAMVLAAKMALMAEEEYGLGAELQAVLATTVFDQLGRGLVAYWPGLAWPDGEGNEYDTDD